MIKVNFNSLYTKKTKISNIIDNLENKIYNKLKLYNIDL